MSNINPDRPTLISGADHKALRDIFRTRTGLTSTPYSQLPQAPIYSFIGKASQAVSANSAGQFTLQDQAPGFLEDSTEVVEAYTLTAINSGEAVPLLWIATIGPGGGYWLAVKGGGSAELCFSPCDLFDLLDTLSLNSEAREILSRMQLDCGCAQETVPCAECKDGAMPSNVTVLVSGVEVNPYDPIGVPNIFDDPDGHAEDLTLYGPSIKEQFNQEHRLEMPGCANFKTLELELADENAVVNYVASLSINFGENDEGTFNTWNAVLSLSKFFGGQVFEYYFSGDDLEADCFGAYVIDFSHLTAQFNSGSWTGEETPYLDLSNLQILIRPTVSPTE